MTAGPSYGVTFHPQQRDIARHQAHGGCAGDTVVPAIEAFSTNVARLAENPPPAGKLARLWAWLGR